MDELELKNIIEALLLSSGEPISLDKIVAVFEEWQKPPLEQMQELIECLQKEYESRSMELIQVAGGFQLQTKAQYGI